jgi:hypothetical protein
MALVAKRGVGAIAALEEQWQEVHEASLATLRQIVSRSQGSALEPAFLATLPSQALSGLRQAEAHAREELGATTALLLEQVATHEVLLEAMYDVHLAAMHDASRLSPQQAADRGTHRLGTSPADRCAALATALRAYEAELQLKQASVHAVRAGAPTLELQALLLSWEVRPRGEADMGVPSCPEPPSAPPSALPVSPSGCPDAHLPRSRVRVRIGLGLARPRDTDTGSVRASGAPRRRPSPRAWLNTWPPPKPPTSPPLAIQVQPMLEPLAAMRAALDSHESLVARVGVGDKCTP